MPQTLLVVDDKTNVRKMLTEYLSEHGFHVVAAEDGQAALYSARYDKPDLVLLDIMMPELDGFQFLTAFRRESSAPVILLTARLEESDKVQGLELGADDYVTKPFGMRELLARVRAQLRRAQQPPVERTRLRVADVVLDRDTHTVSIGDRRVNLTPSEFELMQALMTMPGRVLSRDALLNGLTGAASVERTVDVHIRNLRAKIEADPSQPRYIETVFGLGYRFRADPDGDAH